MGQDKLERKEAYGQLGRHSFIDKFGAYLSLCMIKKHVRGLDHKAIRLLDLGCGYHAKILVGLVSSIDQGTGVDIAVSNRVKTEQGLGFVEKSIEQCVNDFKNSSYNIVLMNSVLEHLEDPHAVLKECYRILEAEGLLLVNVPTWLGKSLLEFSAFKLKLSPAMEMDDHKMYYDQKDLWPLLVSAGFKPSAIKMTRHKFGLNLFAVCRKHKIE